MSLKAQPSPADTNPVRNGDALTAALDEVLDALPDGFVVAGDGEARLVIGPPGAFVLVPLPAGRCARDDAAQRVDLLARETRAALSEHLAWVPFLDALLVSTGPLLRGAGVTVAPVDLLGAVLRDGPAQIQPAALIAIERAIARGRLGRWSGLRSARPVRHVLPAVDGRIDLCLPPMYRAVSPR